MCMQRVVVRRFEAVKARPCFAAARFTFIVQLHGFFIYFSAHFSHLAINCILVVKVEEVTSMLVRFEVHRLLKPIAARYR